MKKYILFFTFILSGISYASYTPYCEGTTVSNAEDAVIQRLVPRFAHEMRCEIGDNCLKKWDVKKTTQNFSIAWKAQCGPKINGQYQLGDEGHGSTFVCETKKENVCCWPLGYERIKNFVLCSDVIFKKKGRN